MLYDPEDAVAVAAKLLRSGHCEGRFIKRNFDDFDESNYNSNDGARDWERRARGKYKNKAKKRAANMETMIEGKIRVKTEMNISLSKKEKAEKEDEK